MLGDRYANDGKPLLKLNQLQLQTKAQVERKIADKTYTFENVKCAVCGSEDYEPLSEKDRYGLYMPVVICRKCGLVQTNPRMTQESYNEFYDSEYRRLYVGTESPTEKFFRGQHEHGRGICEYIGKNTGVEAKNKLVAEVGAGAGGILQYFKEQGNEVYGVDLGSEYVEFGKSKGLNLEVGTGEKLAGLDKKPDIVIYSHYIEHSLDLIGELERLRKLINQDSLVYIEVPGIKNLYNPDYRMDFLRYLQNAHAYHFSLASLDNCLGKAGFERIAGNEVAQSVYGAGDASEKYRRDYEQTMSFLKKAEIDRAKGLNASLLKIEAVHAAGSILRKTRTLGAAKKVHSLLRKKS